MGKSVVMVVDAFYPAGVPPEAKTNTFLALALAERGWDVTVWTNRRGRLPPNSPPNLRVAGTVNRWSVIQVLRLFVWLAIKRPAHVVFAYHSMLYSMEPYITLLPPVAKRLGIACTTLFINRHGPRHNRVTKLLLRYLSPNRFKCRAGALVESSRMVFYSTADRDKILGDGVALFSGRSVVTTPPVDVSNTNLAETSAGVRSALSIGADEFVIGYFGLIYPGKGIETLLDALRVLGDRGVAARLLILGPPGAGFTEDRAWNTAVQEYQDALKRQEKDLALTNVIWAGFVEEAAMPAYIASCDVMGLLFWEGVTGRRSSFITCARLGVPTLTTLGENSDSMFRDAGTGIVVVDRDNAQQVADWLARLKEDRALRETYGRQIADFARRNFDDQSFVDAFDWTQGDALPAHS